MKIADSTLKQPDFRRPVDLSPDVRPERIKIEIHTGGEAFARYHAVEVCRILRKLLAQYEDGDYVPATIKDSNGQVAGHVSIY